MIAIVNHKNMDDNRIEILRDYHLFLQVCAPNSMGDDDVVAACNAYAGGDIFTEVVREAGDSLGREQNKLPVPCGDDPSSRTHLIVLMGNVLDFLGSKMGEWYAD